MDHVWYGCCRCRLCSAKLSDCRSGLWNLCCATSGYSHKAGVTCELPQPDLLCDGAPPCMPRLLVLPSECESGVSWRESASLSTWAGPAEGLLIPCADLNAVVWSALEAPLPDVADLGFCSVPDCTLAPELVGALDWGLLPPAQKLYQIGPCTRHDRGTHPYTDLELDF